MRLMLRPENPLAPPKVHLTQRWLPALALALTVVSVWATYVARWSEGGWSDRFLAGFQFAGALMFILMAHEGGHLFAAKRHRVEVGWPIFIPFPWWVGTLGAVIGWRGLPRSRMGLLEVALFGPIWGAVASVLVLLAALAMGEGTGDGLLGQPLILKLAGLLSGRAVAVGEGDPLLFASWVGFLVTGLNLLPIGQLDGGHAARALWPKAVMPLRWATLVAIAVLGWWWPIWYLWALIAIFTGEAPQVRFSPLPPEAAALAILGGVCWMLSFIPMPW